MFISYWLYIPIFGWFNHLKSPFSTRQGSCPFLPELHRRWHRDGLGPRFNRFQGKSAGKKNIFHGKIDGFRWRFSKTTPSRCPRGKCQVSVTIPELQEAELWQQSCENFVQGYVACRKAGAMVVSNGGNTQELVGLQWFGGFAADVIWWFFCGLKRVLLGDFWWRLILLQCLLISYVSIAVHIYTHMHAGQSQKSKGRQTFCPHSSWFIFCDRVLADKVVEHQMQYSSDNARFRWTHICDLNHKFHGSRAFHWWLNLYVRLDPWRSKENLNPYKSLLNLEFGFV